jgi:hypothetical protein
MALLALSMVSVVWARNLYYHYLLQASLAYSILLGFSFSLVKIEPKDRDMLVAWIIIALFFTNGARNVISGFQGLYDNMENNDFYRISNYIADKTSVNDTIFVLGGQPVIYFLSERRSPTRYLFWIHHGGYRNWLISREKLALEGRDMDSSVMADFQANMPKYIVYTEAWTIWSEGVNPRDFALKKFMDENYELEDTFGDMQLYRLKGY